MPPTRAVVVLLLAGLGAVTAAVGSSGDPAPTVEATAARAALPPLGLTVAAPLTDPASFDVAAENRSTGTKGWHIGKAAGTAPGLTLTSTVVSVAPGEPVPLDITLAAPGPVRVRVLRVGWYAGAGARTLSQDDVASVPRSARLPLRTAGWPPGHYLVRVDAGPASRFLPVTLRSPSARGRMLLLTSPSTWRAERTVARPGRADAGARGFVSGDAALVQLAEREGLDLAYATDTDVAADPALLRGADAVVAGNSKVWPTALRKAIRAAVARGSNLALFGAGAGGKARTATLTGLAADCSTAGPTSWTVTDPGWWGYRGTGAYAGRRWVGLVGGATDTPAIDRATGAAVVVAAGGSRRTVASTELTCGARATTAAATYSVQPSGAGVFSTGTTRWNCALNRTCSSPVGEPAREFAVQVTRTVLRGFAVAEAGRRIG